MNNLYSLKLTISNFCGYNCKYCYVNTNSTSKLDLSLGKKYIKYYLSQFGIEKKIFFLGGEALLEFTLLKELILFSKKEAKKKNKKLILFLTTSGLSLKLKKVYFLFNNDVKIGVSIDGNKYIHGLNRISKRGQNTYNHTINAIGLLNTLYDDTNLGYALTVNENTVNYLFKSFLFLSNLDDIHRNITIVGVYEKKWGTSNIKKFEEEIIKICTYIINNIKKNRFFYYKTLGFFILGLLKGEKYTKGNMEMHIFPNGETSLMLFKQSILGNIDSDPHHFRFEVVYKIAYIIIEKGKTDILFKKYILTLYNKTIL